MQNRYYMKDEVPFSDFPAYTENSTNKGKAIWIFLIVILIIAGIVGGLYFLGKNKKADNKAIAPTHAPSPTLEPSPTSSASATLTATPSGKLTPTPSGTSSKLDRSKLSVAVLNGSGVPGAANKTATTLRGLGYTVGATANADKFTYTGITVLVKKAKKDYGDLLKKDLSDQGTVTVTVDDAIPTDAQVIVGK
jgi:hypothetical protein